jgi:hypothetical protein
MPMLEKIRSEIDDVRLFAKKNTTLRALASGIANNTFCLMGMIFSREINVPKNPPTIMAPWCAIAGCAKKVHPILFNPLQRPLSRQSIAKTTKGILEVLIIYNSNEARLNVVWVNVAVYNYTSRHRGKSGRDRWHIVIFLGFLLFVLE